MRRRNAVHVLNKDMHTQGAAFKSDDNGQERT